MNRQKGFNLVELIIVMGIIGILSGVAYPAYVQHMLETRRSDAWIALNSVAAGQQRWYAVNFSYTDDLNRLGGDRSSEGFYDISLVANDTAFTITATARSSSVQASDTGCTVLTLSETGAQTPVECW